MVNQFLSSESDKINEINTLILKVRGKTLIFGNSIFQISNISSLELVDLSTVKPIPKYFWWMLIIGLIFLFPPNLVLKLLGVLILGILSWLIFRYKQDKQKTKYGLSIRLNAGTRTTIVSDNIDFLKRIMLVLYNIMNSDELKAVNFNFDRCRIEDKSIDIDQMIYFNVAEQSITGNFVSNV